MKEIDRKYFEALHNDRSDSADTFEKPSTREMWRSIVEKYSDQAHFIYELIQNADDAGATTARFVLEKERLIFAHNGKRHFSISNPANEDKDSKEGVLGDINAITGIAFSNKKTQENKIGKFGVGFKAVFQYTSSPRIYDPEFRFRIDRYIVPSQIDEDFPGRKSNETLFVFPFDHKDRNPKETYADIESKLKALSYPILFLTNLLDISFEIGNLDGLYGKSILEKINYGDTESEKVRLMQTCGDEIISKYIWLFTRYDNDLKYSVGFFINEDNHLIPTNEPAFCYFPTKEMTGLNFLVHAPFILTDSREGIRSGMGHNNRLIMLLAKLSADSLLYLKNYSEKNSKRIIDDDIFSIIPIDEESFCDLDDTSRISFKPFYSEIKKLFVTENIIPTRTGYTNLKNAYWAAVTFLNELFSDEQLAEICENPNAKWAFISLGRDEVLRNNKILFDYINCITTTGLNEDNLVKGRFTSYYSGIKDIEGITSEFIENQSAEWLHRFYKWLSETTHRIDLAKIVPVFLDQDSKASAAYDSSGEHLILFLPSKEILGCKTVREDFLKNKHTYELIKKIGITYPSIHDQIYNKVIPEYKKGKVVDTNSHFLLFFKYYRECSHEDIEEFIDEIRDCEFISYYIKLDSKIYKGKASDLYFPYDNLVEYFDTKPSTKFVAYDEYKSLVGVTYEKTLKSFFIDLGVKENVDIYNREIIWKEQIKRKDLPLPNSTTTRRYDEYCIDGCRELINFIVQNQSKEKSKVLWNQLLLIIDNCRYGNLTYLLYGTCHFFYYNNKTERFSSSDVSLLKNSNWILSNDGNFVSPSELTLDNISDIYYLEDENISSLLDFLSISKKQAKEVKDEDNSNLTEMQREKMKFSKLAEKYEVSIEQMEELLQNYVNEKAKFKQDANNSTDFLNVYNIIELNEDANGSNDQLETSQKEIQSTNSLKKQISQATSRVAKDILSKTQTTPSVYIESVIDDFEEIDEDEYIPSPVDFSRKVELEKEKAAKAIDRITYQESLQKKALNSKKYSFGWFKSILNLEVLNSNANNINSREVSISFAHVEREPNTHRTLILKQPNRYIPQFMEDLSDIPLVIDFENQSKTLVIEVANVKSYTLRVKLKSNFDVSNLDFSKATEARIDAKSPVFLLEELRKQFNSLDYDDKFDMQENLCDNIEFVFGPPGTGKTTYLAKDVLIPLMNKKEKLKVLVLTPTNKSADVLIRKVMDVMNNDNSYNEWLIRFGGTSDEIIEQSPIYRDKTIDIRTFSKNVTVTTIARFPYDFFMPQGTRIYLNSINWDYIIIDEASMIPLVNIIYPLYKKNPQKFIIAGDPFQIEPITSVDLWKNENIYTMVQLDSFVEPHTIPHDYKVKLLTTQYRSIPSVGRIFSKFAYGGILQHYRKENKRKRLNLDGLNIESLNIIKYPISKYESIYRSKRLQRSSAYHIYSALFTFEYVSYLAKMIANKKQNEFLRIGIIAPYRAQADLIEKLVGSDAIPKNIDIQVGTIHGFQGDECDIIFAVFNTPPTITSGKDMFLNKRNIINVSISRAKDYLFIVMPDDDTENINNLRLVKRVEQLVKENGAFTEIETSKLEKLIFGNEKYLEENSFSTGHQSVNVYGLPEKCYEIRSEDTAVDIQIHRNVSKMVQNKNEITEKLNDGLHDVNHSEELEFLWINENVKICPFDKVQMNYQAIPVKKKDGSLKKLNMLVCPTCKGKFLVDGCVPDSVNLSEYCVLGKRLNSQNVLDSPIKKSENSTAKYVYSSKYGAGEIIKRFKQDKETRIVVRFKSREVTYNEEIAFKNETLVKK